MEPGKDGWRMGWREGGWGWEDSLPRGHTWEMARDTDTLPRKDKRIEASLGSCLCLPLRSGVLAIGLLGSILATSGLVAYAIVQVPTLRMHLGQYFSPPHDRTAQESDSLRRIAYTSEIVGAVLTSTLGLLVNLLLIWGVLHHRRWFLLHWLFLHLLLCILLFVTSLLIFVAQDRLWKLLGLLPVLLALVTMYCWSKVYELFLSMRDPCVSTCKQHGPSPSLAGGVPTVPGPNWRQEEEVSASSQPNTVEFYPVDPLSRGMSERMRGWNMVCLPYRDQDSPYLGTWERTSHTYRRTSESEGSSIVPSIKDGRQPRQDTVDTGDTTLEVNTVNTSRTDSRVSTVEI